MMLDLRARAALASARASHNAPELLRRARRDAHRLRREPSDCAKSLGNGLLAALAVAHGDRDEASALLRSALAGFDRWNLELRAASIRRHLGTLVGGGEGRDLIAEADARMGKEGVVNPARMASMYVPTTGA
jgi:hypothetical protein